MLDAHFSLCAEYRSGLIPHFRHFVTLEPPTLIRCMCYILRILVLHVVTHRWSFDDGLGITFARFNIDLYYCGGGCSITGDCGEMVARLCEVRDLPRDV